MVLSSSPLILIEITFLITIQRSLKSVFDFPLNAKSWAWSLSLPINVEKFIHSCCSNWTSNHLFQPVPINKINFCKCSIGFSSIPNEFDATVSVWLDKCAIRIFWDTTFTLLMTEGILGEGESLKQSMNANFPSFVVIIEITQLRICIINKTQTRCRDIKLTLFSRKTWKCN